MNDDGERIHGLERLARRRSPERDLWPGIHARLAPRRRSRYPVMQFALAASVVAGLATVMTLGLRHAELAPSAGATLAGSPVRMAAALAPRATTSDSRAIVQANLSLVEQAERQLKQALKQDPESTTLRSLLQSAEQRQRSLRAML